MHFTADSQSLVENLDLSEADFGPSLLPSEHFPASKNSSHPVSDCLPNGLNVSQNGTPNVGVGGGDSQGHFIPETEEDDSVDEGVIPHYAVHGRTIISSVPASIGLPNVHDAKSETMQTSSMGAEGLAHCGETTSVLQNGSVPLSTGNSSHDEDNSNSCQIVATADQPNLAETAVAEAAPHIQDNNQDISLSASCVGSAHKVTDSVSKMDEPADMEEVKALQTDIGAESVPDSLSDTQTVPCHGNAPETVICASPSESISTLSSSTVDINLVEHNVRPAEPTANGTTTSVEQVEVSAVTELPSDPMRETAVGFGQLEEVDITEDDIDDYLGKTEDTCSMPSRSLAQELNQATIQPYSAASGGESSPVATPDQEEQPENLQTPVNEDSPAIEDLAPAATEPSEPAVQEDKSDSESDRPCEHEERRNSSESIEKFLVPSVLSPMITTPREDPGFTKVPGFSPHLSAMVEEDGDAGESVQDIGDAQEQPTVTDANIDNTETSSHTTAGEIVPHTADVTRPSDLTGGARPKDAASPSAHPARTARPTSLRGLSTPDLSTPLVGTKTIRDCDIVQDFDSANVEQSDRMAQQDCSGNAVSIEDVAEYDTSGIVEQGLVDFVPERSVVSEVPPVFEPMPAQPNIPSGLTDCAPIPGSVEHMANAPRTQRPSSLRLAAPGDLPEPASPSTEHMGRPATYPGDVNAGDDSSEVSTEGGPVTEPASPGIPVGLDVMGE